MKLEEYLELGIDKVSVRTFNILDDIKLYTSVILVNAVIQFFITVLLIYIAFIK